MAKIVLPSVASGYNVSTINANFQALATELNNKVLYRNNPIGEANQLSSDIDVNSRRLYNLPAPVSDSEPVRKGDVSAVLEEATSRSELAAEAAAESAAFAATQATASQNSAQTALLAVLNAEAQVASAQGWATASQNSSVSSANYAADAEASAALADSIADSLAGGTIGFNASSYDFGFVSDPTTYFNRDFGLLV